MSSLRNKNVRQQKASQSRRSAPNPVVGRQQRLDFSEQQLAPSNTVADSFPFRQSQTFRSSEPTSVQNRISRGQSVDTISTLTEVVEDSDVGTDKEEEKALVNGGNGMLFALLRA